LLFDHGVRPGLVDLLEGGVSSGLALLRVGEANLEGGVADAFDAGVESDGDFLVVVTLALDQDLTELLGLEQLGKFLGHRVAPSV